MRILVIPRLAKLLTNAKMTLNEGVVRTLDVWRKILGVFDKKERNLNIYCLAKQL
jgi:hypothetical protein